MTKIWEKIDQLRPIEPLAVADFGTRRRHSFLWQDWCVQAMIEGLGDKFSGTSNCLIAMRREVEAIGTNAHEIPMVYAALAQSDAKLEQAPYAVLSDWQQEHDGNLLIMLPDTFGSEGFFRNAPGWSAKWTGVRVDSGLPEKCAENAVRWWHEHGEDPGEKLVIFSDGLDVDDIERLARRFSGRTNVAFGWGTLLTNDFRGLVSDGALDPFSVVCKLVQVDGKPTVKLSDDANKSLGPDHEVLRYRRVFGTAPSRYRDVVV